jgi:DNA-binding NtrC family response regulator
MAILQTLRHVRGNKARAARELGISEKSIYNKLKCMGIDY